MSANLKKRRVAVIMADSYHNLDLIEVETHVRQEQPRAGQTPLELPYRIDRREVEDKARAALELAGKDPDKFDYVGTLVSNDAPMVRGRIMWAVEVEPVHVEV